MASSGEDDNGPVINKVGKEGGKDSLNHALYRRKPQYLYGMEEEEWR